LAGDVPKRTATSAANCNVLQSNLHTDLPSSFALAGTVVLPAPLRLCQERANPAKLNGFKRCVTLPQTVPEVTNSFGYYFKKGHFCSFGESQLNPARVCRGQFPVCSWPARSL